MKDLLFRVALLACSLLIMVCRQSGAAEPITIAAAADLRFAMDDLVRVFNQGYPDTKVNVIFGSSGNLYQQIVNQASFQIFFSADVAYARKLDSLKMTTGRPQLYAIGHLVLWSSLADVSKGVQLLVSDKVKKIAIANPSVAPYGNRAVESLIHYGIYDKVIDKIVKGENVSQAAQFVLTGNAEAGIIALSLALSSEMMSKGKYAMIDEASYSRLEQAYVILKSTGSNGEVMKFVKFLDSRQARKIFIKYGFKLPGE